MPSTTPSLPPASEWKAEHARFTLIYAQSEPNLQKKREVLQTITSKEPFEQVFRHGTYTEGGEWHGGTLRIASLTGRMDFVYNPNEKVESGSATVKANVREMASFSKVFDPLQEAMQKWLEVDEGPVQRLAFGATIFLPVNDRLEGYQKIAGYLRDLKIDAENSRDLLYRINRPRTVNIDGDLFFVNRLSTWSVGIRRAFTFTVSTSGANPMGSTPSESMLMIEMDLSTDANREGLFKAEESNELLKIFVGLAVEICENGDVP